MKQHIFGQLIATSRLILTKVGQVKKSLAYAGLSSTQRQALDLLREIRQSAGQSLALVVGHFEKNPEPIVVDLAHDQATAEALLPIEDSIRARDVARLTEFGHLLQDQTQKCIGLGIKSWRINLC